jgi:hypothetical protein
MIRRVGGVIVLVALMAASLGAGTGTGGEAGTLCEARDDVQAALDRLLDVDVIREGTNALRAALEQLRAALTDFAELARGQGEQVRGDISQLRAAIDAVPATIRDSEGEPLVDRARSIADALALVVNQTGQLLQSVAPVCP